MRMYGFKNRWSTRVFIVLTLGKHLLILAFPGSTRAEVKIK